MLALPLTYLRALALASMPDLATVERKTETTAPDGTPVITLSNLGPYPCRLEASMRLPRELAQGARLVAVTVWICYLPHGTDVRPSDVLIVGGERFEVSDDNDARSDSPVEAVTVHRVQ